MDHAILDAITADPATTPVNRQNLLDVLTFLERRGASPEVMRLAMERAGIHPDVAQLISRCAPQVCEPQDCPTQPEAPTAMVATPKPDAPTQSDRGGVAAQRALRALLRGTMTWLLLLGAGIAAGVAVGYEVGVSQGFEAGLDRLASALQSR